MHIRESDIFILSLSKCLIAPYGNKNIKVVRVTVTMSGTSSDMRVGFVPSSPKMNMTFCNSDVNRFGCLMANFD